MAYDNRSYSDMTREELVEIIGTDVDPSISRDDLIRLAMEREGEE